jgi:hypothetical protein
MAATIELKYFNSFWLKKLDTVVDVLPFEIKSSDSAIVGSNRIDFPSDLITVGVPQEITYTVGSETFVNIVLYGSPGNSYIILKTPIITEIPLNTVIKFGSIKDFSYIQEAYGSTPESDWYVEEARIRVGYNNTSVDFGVKAYIVEDVNGQQYRSNSMIYSGIFNSRTGVNNTNQFSIAEDIIRSVEPSQGSIQKLYAEDTNLIIFQERKVSRALIDKDAIYSAEGQPMTTSAAQVIGQIQSYAGNYGISTNPESFAVYGYRKYFTDRNQNAVLRLSQDGITEISANGMIDYFRDNLSGVGEEGKIVGSWDMHNKLYVLSMQPPLAISGRNDTDRFQTLSFDEDINGWTSLYSFKPQLAGSLRENYFTFKNGNIWQHYAPTTKVSYCNFYGVQYSSKVTLVLNPSVSESKSFNTINYEGSPGWALTDIYTDSDNGLSISSFVLPTNLGDLQNQLFATSFKNKENKYFGTIINNTSANQGEVVYGNSMSGIKGYYATATFQFPDPFLNVGSRSQTKLAELFAVSSNYVHSYY